MRKHSEFEVKIQVLNVIASERVISNDIWSKETAFFISLEYLSAEVVGTKAKLSTF